MKKWILCLLVIPSLGYAQDSFQDELKLPIAHYSPKSKKVVVEVSPDYQNAQNLQAQEELVNNIINSVGEENVVIKEKTEKSIIFQEN